MYLQDTTSAAALLEGFYSETPGPYIHLHNEAQGHILPYEGPYEGIGIKALHRSHWQLAHPSSTWLAHDLRIDVASASCSASRAFVCWFHQLH